MEKALIAQRVAGKLFATEKAVDAAIREATQLLGGMIEAREQLGVSTVVGADQMAKVADALAALVKAQSTMAEAHHDLNDLKLRLGIRTKMIGSGPKSFGETVVTGSANDRAVG